MTLLLALRAPETPALDLRRLVPSVFWMWDASPSPRLSHTVACVCLLYTQLICVHYVLFTYAFPGVDSSGLLTSQGPCAS